MKCSIIIPTYNHLEDCLKPCIESLLRYTDLTNMEVIVVANGCTDETRKYLATKPVKRLWYDEPLGFTKASNAGAGLAVGEYLIFLNNDTILLEQDKNIWVEYLINPFKEQIDVGVTGPHLLNFLNYQFVVGFCLATPRYLFALLNGFNEEYSPGTGEDIEYCIQLQRAGYRILRVPSEEGNHFPIYHKAESTINDNRKEWEQIYKRNMEILRRKYENTL